MSNRRRWHAALVSVLLVCASGCGTPSREPDPQDGLLPVDAGVEVKLIDAIDPVARVPGAVRMVENLVVSAEAGAVELFQPRSVVAVPDGRIFVVDGASNEVKVFGPSGDYLSRFGGTGQGPGEFTRLARLVLAGDSLVAYDSRSRRLSTWTFDGQLVEEHTLARLSFVDSLQGADDGTLVAVLSDYAADAERMEIVRISRSGERLATYHSVTRARSGGRSDAVADLQEALGSLLAGVDTQYATGVGGAVYLANLNAYEVHAYDLAGAPRWTLRVPWPGRPWTRMEKENLLATLTQGMPAGAVAIDDLEWPPRSHALWRIATDGAGRLHVFLDAEEGVMTGGLRWVDVFSRQGELVAAGALPSTWATAQGDYVYGLRPNAADETEVVRYRLMIGG